MTSIEDDQKGASRSKTEFVDTYNATMEAYAGQSKDFNAWKDRVFLNQLSEGDDLNAAEYKIGLSKLIQVDLTLQKLISMQQVIIRAQEEQLLKYTDERKSTPSEDA